MVFLSRLSFSVVSPLLTRVVAVAIGIPFIVIRIVITTVMPEIRMILSVMALVSAIVPVAVVGSLVVIAADVAATIAI